MSANQKVNILMVDDQPGKLISYRAILDDLGENLIPATSGKEALEVLLKNEIAIILMDVSMPELNGFELADMIHQHPRFQKTAIIFISAVHLTDLDRIKGYQRGAMDYISVPVVPELLRAKVSLFADLYRKTRELHLLNSELERRVRGRTEELQESAQQIRNLNDQLQQRIAELESIMKVLPVGVSVAHDPFCCAITGNAAMSELLGARHGENVSLGAGSGDAGYEVYHEGRRLAPEELPLQRAAATGRPVGTSELEIHHKDGRITQALGSANPLFDDSGNVRGAVGALIDITERKRMEQTLRERADLMDMASEAIMVRDLDGIVRFWNSGAAALYGWTSEEAVGTNLHQLLRTAFPVARHEIESILIEGRRWEGNLVQSTKDGREIVVASRKSLQRDGRNRGVVLEICRDITVQLQAEEALRKSEKLAAMGRMAGIVAHEINNPLGAITNVFYLLRDHPSLDEEARNYARLAEEELIRVTHITRQTLGFYRESAHTIPVSIPSLLEDTLNFQSRQLQTNRIVVDRRYRSDGIVQGFPGELKQVFLNLIGNAIEAMPDGGCLRLHVRDVHEADGPWTGVRVSILDTGLGIEPDDAKRLFQPFFSTKSTKGTGLGLWISRGIIQKHEGTIRFRSTCLRMKKVTCFSVVIPASSLSEQIQANAASKAEALSDSDSIFSVAGEDETADL
jgi:PAS domain S-box-containing protein